MSISVRGRRVIARPDIFHRQSIAQKRIAGILGQHFLNLLLSRFGGHEY